MNNYEKIINLATNNNGYITTKMVMENTIANMYLTNLVKTGKLERLIGTVISGFLRFRVKIRFFPRTTTVFAPRTTNPIRIFRQRRLQEV